MANKELLWLRLDRITFAAEVPGGVLTRLDNPTEQGEGTMGGLAFIPNCIIQQEETIDDVKQYSLQPTNSIHVEVVRAGDQVINN